MSLRDTYGLPTGETDKDLATLMALVQNVISNEDWEKTQTDDDSDDRGDLMDFMDGLTKVLQGTEGSWQVGIWVRRDPADETEARAILGELAQTEPGWAYESQEDDGVFLVTVPKAFADEARSTGCATRLVGDEGHIDAEWPV